MENYDTKQILFLQSKDPKITYGDLSNELKMWYYFEKNQDGSIVGNPPITIIAIGKSLPNQKYYIKRKECQFYILEYVSDGIGYIETNNDKIKVEKGDVYLLKKGSTHYYYSDKNKPYAKYWINFKSDILDAMINASPLKDVIKIENVFCENLFIELLNAGNKSPYHSSICYDVFEVLLKIFNKLIQVYNTGNFSKTPDNISMIKDILDQSIYINITIDEICEKVYLSNSYVISKFKEYYGVTPHQYLMDSKIKQATILLHDKNMNISEIALKLGFYDAYHFSKLFKKKTGLSPKKYRSSI